MNNIDDACRDAVVRIEGAIACVMVDLDSGRLLGIHKSDQYARTANEIAVVTMDMFRGNDIEHVGQMVRTLWGGLEKRELDFEEAYIASADHLHFAKTMRNGRAAVLLVMKKDTNIGMGWIRLKSLLPTLESLIF